MKRAGLAFICLVLLACSTDPVDIGLPDPDPSLDPQSLAASPSAIFICGKWVDGGPPAAERIFVDISFKRTGDDDEFEHPTSSDLSAVKRSGGQVVYAFHVRAVRAWIVTADIPKLEKEPSVNLILRVPDLTRYDWLVGARYRPSYSLDSASVRFAKLGGRVDWRFNSIHAVSGMLPDRSIATLRGDANTLWVEGQEGFSNCF